MLVNVEASPWLNGSTGVIDKYDKASGRFNVRLDADGTLHAVSYANMKSVGQAGWTRAYSRWLEGISEDVALAVDAAAEVTTVIVPGFILPKKSSPPKPLFEIHLKYLFALTALQVFTPLFLLTSPLAEVICFIAAVGCGCVLCSSISRIIKVVVLATVFIGTVLLAWKVCT